MIVSITKYNSDNQITKDVMGEACSTCGGRGEFAHRVLVEKPQRKRPHGKPGRK